MWDPSFSVVESQQRAAEETARERRITKDQVIFLALISDYLTMREYGATPTEKWKVAVRDIISELSPTVVEDIIKRAGFDLRQV